MTTLAILASTMWSDCQSQCEERQVARQRHRRHGFRCCCKGAREESSVWQRSGIAVRSRLGFRCPPDPHLRWVWVRGLGVF